MTLSRILTFVHSSPNVVGCSLGLMGLALFFGEVISSNWQLIVIGLYVFGYLITPNPPQVVPKDTTVLSPTELMISLDKLVRRVQRRIPQDMLDHVLEIKVELDGILRRFGEIRQDLHSTHLIHQTIMVYLPRILDTYIKIPAKDADRYKLRSGQTPTEIAVDQLQLLLTELRELSKTLTKKSIQDLKIHQNFLRAKFGEEIDTRRT